VKPDALTLRRESLRELRTIPGIGPSLALDLYELGVRRIADLKRRNPERMYRQLERQTGTKQDRCVLYVFRCAVYFAKTPKPKPERLLWWNWQDKPAPRRKVGT
jgi:predicted RecB family nuclease